MATCLICNTQFTPRAGGKPQKYCSLACRQQRDLAARRSQNADRVVVKECPQCGNQFTQGIVGAPKKYCSEACNIKVQNRRASRRPVPPRARVTKVCPVCGRSFLAKRVDRVYCYEGWCGQTAHQRRVAAGEPKRQVAREIECAGCGKVFTGVHVSAKWCSSECSIRYHMQVRNRSKRMAAPAGTYIDREVFVRDGWRCHLCGKRIDQTLKSPDPMSATIDHLVPVALGGTDTLANVAAAHRSCNRAKGVNAADEQLRIL